MKRWLAVTVFSAAMAGLGYSGSFNAGVAIADDAAAAKALPPGKEIVEKYIEATGGRAAYEKLTSRITKGTLDVPAQGLKAKLTIVQQAPDKGLVQTEFAALGMMKQGSDGETAWANDPMQGARILTGGEREMLIRQFRFDGDTDWQKYYKAAETLAVEEINGSPAYKVKLTPTTEGMADSIAFYDQKSGLVVRMDTIMQSPMGEIAVVSKLSEYKEFDGIKIPTSTTQEAAGMTMSMTIESVEHNQPIDAAMLELPPDIRKLKDQQPPATQPGK